MLTDENLWKFFFIWPQNELKSRMRGFDRFFCRGVAGKIDFLAGNSRKNSFLIFLSILKSKNLKILRIFLIFYFFYSLVCFLGLKDEDWIGRLAEWYLKEMENFLQILIMHIMKLMNCFFGEAESDCLKVMGISVGRWIYDVWGNFRLKLWCFLL